MNQTTDATNHTALTTLALTPLQTQFFTDLIALLKIASVRDETTVDACSPVGIGNRQALDFMFALAERDGFTCCNVDNIAGHIEWGSGEEIIGLIGHLDVVPADNNWTITEPFTPLIKKGYLYARGVSDDKGPIMAAYYAMKQLKAQGIYPNKRVRLILGTDEESQWQCVKAYFAQQPKPDIGFSPDSLFPIVNSEKGSVSMQIDVPVCADSPLVEFYSGEKRNVVPDKATATIRIAAPHISAVQQQFSQFLAEQQLTGSLDYDPQQQYAYITLIGQSCHGSQPQLGKNAGTYLACWLADFVPDNHFLNLVKQKFHLNYHGALFDCIGLAKMDNLDTILSNLSLNIGILRYSDDLASLQINFRYPATLAQADLAQLIGDNVVLPATWCVIGQPKLPHFVAENTPLVQMLKYAYTDVTGQPADCLTSGGVSFSQLFDNCVGFGALFPHGEDTMHQIDEKSSVADLLTTIDIYTVALQQLIEYKS